jgi:hypothetical protein
MGTTEFNFPNSSVMVETRDDAVAPLQSTCWHGRIFFHKFIDRYCRVLVRRLALSNMPASLFHRHYQEPNPVFWTSTTALSVFACLALAAITGRFWILHGISLLIVDRIFVVLVKWIIFTLDDRELQMAGHYLRWLLLVLREGEKIMTSQSAAEYIMAATLLKSAPTGVSYVRWIIRYKMKLARYEFIREVGKDRLSRKSSARALAAINQAKTQAKLVKSKVHDNVKAVRQTVSRSF